jgi:phage/plasmid primase-like uncharacterized protein
MLDLNDTVDLDELFQAYGVEDILAFFTHYPMFRAPEEFLSPLGGTDQAGIDRGANVRGWRSSGEYVKTTGIQTAVRGHEWAVLQHLGIEWNGQRGHIKCPYPDHGGDADWRWDDKEKLAFCTCIGKRSGERKTTHNIFNVAETMLDIGFDDAKVCVAKLIRREDLIKIANGERYQKTDAESLLNPPATNRDDTLVWRYLGDRLDIDPRAVLRPTTPVAGHRRLAYFDPPAKEGGKPKLVDTAPCAVFGQIDRDNRRHAHRIYLKPDGCGKANFGIGADGQPREVKKLAKVIDGDRTSGRAVVWGDPAVACLTVSCEGVETGTAIAVAFRPEIDNGQVVVVACISAVGLEAFRPWPAPTAMIVAADRDEGLKPDGRERDQRGERAARTLCMRQKDIVRCGIALPGVPGEKVDWLDILLREGVLAVRQGVFRAVEFVPTADEIDRAVDEQNRAAELDEIAATYPLPVMENTGLQYAHTPAGKVKVHKKDLLGMVAIATPFGVPARLRHIDQADAYGLRCVVQDMNGKPRAVDFDRAMLGRMGAADIRALLFQAGLRTEGDGDTIAVQSLKAADPDREIIVVKQPGWHEIPGCAGPIFVAPDGRVIGAPDGLDLELAASVRMPPELAMSGTLDDWRAAVAIAIAVLDCQHWTIGVLGGFVGPLVNLTRLQSCGINLSGLSTSGKSTGQRLAVSSWSKPQLRHDNGLFQSAHTTENAIEPLAQRATGTVLALDELAHVTGKTVAGLVYTIAGDTGKKRMNSDASLRQSYTWSTFAILSCECSLEEKVRSEGGEWRAGMAVRFPDIDVTEVNRAVDRATLTAIDSIDRHYGHAGHAFVSKLIEHGLHLQASALRDRIFKAAEVIAASTDGATVRAAIPFALLLVAGEMAVKFELLPAGTPVKEAVQWAWERFKRSSDAAALDPEAQTIANIQRWIAERWDVTVRRVEAGYAVNNRDAVGWYDETAVYIPIGRIREAAGNALKQSQIGSLLHKRGLLAKKEPDRFYIKYMPLVGRVAAYALSRREFGRTEQFTEPSFSIYEGRQHA